MRWEIKRLLEELAFRGYKPSTIKSYKAAIQGFLSFSGGVINPWRIHEYLLIHPEHKPALCFFQKEILVQGLSLSEGSRAHPQQSQSQGKQ
jgi:hypothetical protein